MLHMAPASVPAGLSEKELLPSLRRWSCSLSPAAFHLKAHCACSLLLHFSPAPFQTELWTVKKRKKRKILKWLIEGMMAGSIQLTNKHIAFPVTIVRQNIVTSAARHFQTTVGENGFIRGSSWMHFALQQCIILSIITTRDTVLPAYLRGNLQNYHFKELPEDLLQKQKKATIVSRFGISNDNAIFFRLFIAAIMKSLEGM